MHAAYVMQAKEHGRVPFNWSNKQLGLRTREAAREKHWTHETAQRRVVV